ncbi:MAG: NAD(P)H-dependent oxidoreductase [Mobilicoccus sp.]|nr:NAD(P)H-dependent oxidoreductase [Mobilicoccus sp.]
MKIGIIIGSIRTDRAGKAVGHWVHEQASERDDAQFELIDITEHDLELLDEATVPGAANRKYDKESTRRWGAKIDEFDAFIFVTPEYNHGVPGAMKNAFDLIYPEWGNKAVAFVGYGADGGVRAVEQWRGIALNAYLYPARAQVALSLFTDWGKDGFAPADRRTKELTALFDELVPLAGAIKTLRD